MILKLLLVIGVIAVVYLFFIKKKPIRTQNKKTEQESNDMVACSECGVYAELDESILSNSKYYCSKECLDKVK